MLELSEDQIQEIIKKDRELRAGRPEWEKRLEVIRQKVPYDLASELEDIIDDIHEGLKDNKQTDIDDALDAIDDAIRSLEDARLSLE